MADNKLGLLLFPSGYRCEAARHFSYHAGRNYNERLNVLRKLRAGSWKSRTSTGARSASSTSSRRASGAASRSTAKVQPERRET
eukprot:7261005-Alexandrium_andersonii.AAC.1